jgi:hypothetical protein
MASARSRSSCRVLPTGLLLESIPGAERVFQMLQASVSSAKPATVPAEFAPTASEPSEPPLLPGRGWTLQRFGAFIPWWGGLIFFGLGMFMVIAIVSSPQNGPVIVIVLFPLVFAVMGAWILWSNLSVTLTRRRLLASGTVVMARVIGLADASAEVNGDDQWAVRYEYDAGGQTQTGDSPFMSQAAAMRWATGDRVSVRYDPARPEVSIWLGGDPASGS